MKYCAKCGNEIEDGSLFCTNCGHSTNSSCLKTVLLVVTAISTLLNVIMFHISLAIIQTIFAIASTIISVLVLRKDKRTLSYICFFLGIANLLCSILWITYI